MRIEKVVVNSSPLIGIEIFEASSFIRDSIFESVQARVSNFQKADNGVLRMDG